jgi:hypothetical protein
MDLTSLAIIAALVVVTCGAAFRRRGRARVTGPAQTRRTSARTAARAAPPRDASAKRPICTHAVSVETGLTPCAAAIALSDRRFLSNEAPPLPLPDCDSDSCGCRYAHHDDRRSGDDRRMPFFSLGSFGVQHAESDRRTRRDRRRRR